MQIRFQREGGWGPIAHQPLRLFVDTDDLPQDEADHLTRAVHESGVFDLSEDQLRPATAGIPDAFTYVLQISDRQRHVRIQCSDPLPPGLGELTGLLQARALEG